MAEPETTAPTQTDMKAGAEVVAAGQAAAEAEPDQGKKRGAARTAIRSAAKEKGWELTDQDADKLAGAVVGKLEEIFSELPGNVAESIRQMGGFDHLPEPLAPPAAPTGGGALPAEPPAAPATGHDEAPGAGRSRGASAFAGWFRGRG